MVGDSAIVLPNSGVRIHIYHKDKNLKISFYDATLQLIYEEATFNGGYEAYYLSWSKNERFFALTYKSQWYEDLYFIDIEKKRIVYEITGHNMLDGSRSVAFYQNKALILPTLNFEGGISDFKIFNFETLQEEKILNSEHVKFNGLVVEDSCVDVSETYLFVRSNFYFQENLCNQQSSIGVSFENLFNVKRLDSVVRCFRMDRLVNEKIFDEIEIDTSDLQDGKMIFENSNIENGLIGILHFIKSYQIQSIEIRKKPSKIFLLLFPHKIEGFFLISIL